MSMKTEYDVETVIEYLRDEKGISIQDIVDKQLHCRSAKNYRR